MATILQTNTEFTKSSGTFSMVTSYSGEVNPNVTFIFTLTVLDVSTPIVGAQVIIGTNTYITDGSGQIIVSLIRGDYVAYVSAVGYIDNNISFTILDSNVTDSIVLTNIGSFSLSFDNSYENN
jgi:hypothetical protein